MNKLLCRIIVLSLSTAFVLVMLTDRADAQTRLTVRGSAKAEIKNRSGRVNQSQYKLPKWWLEVPEGGLPKVAVPHHARVSISPVPTPIPHPVPHHERDEIERGNLAELMEALLEMYADSVLQGDLGAADMIEDLLIIVPEYIIVPNF